MKTKQQPRHDEATGPRAEQCRCHPNGRPFAALEIVVRRSDTGELVRRLVAAPGGFKEVEP